MLELSGHGADMETASWAEFERWCASLCVFYTLLSLTLTTH